MQDMVAIKTFTVLKFTEGKEVIINLEEVLIYQAGNNTIDREGIDDFLLGIVELNHRFVEGRCQHIDVSRNIRSVIDNENLLILTREGNNSLVIYALCSKVSVVIAVREGHATRNSLNSLDEGFSVCFAEGWVWNINNNHSIIVKSICKELTHQDVLIEFCRVTNSLKKA